MQISTKDQFSALMTDVDESLKGDGVPITARQIQGWIRVCKKLKLSLPLMGEAIPNIYEGESLSGHICDWFRARYGERLKIDFSPGYFPIEIHSDLYLVRLPMIFGSAALFVDRSLRPPHDQLNRISRKPNPLNILDLIVDLTESARQSLSDDELNSISQACITALDQSSAWQMAGKEFQDAVADDLKLSATLAVEGKLGLSRWHSLQSSEKALKSYIKNSGSTAPHIHDLKKLHSKAAQAGLSTIGLIDLTSAQCKADVRYEKKSSTQSETLTANEAARRICTAIATQLSEQKRA